MRSARALQPGLDEAPGNRLRGRRQHLARVELCAREPACVLELSAHAHAAPPGGMRVIGDLEDARSEEHTAELQSHGHLGFQLLPEKKNTAHDALNGI